MTQPQPSQPSASTFCPVPSEQQPLQEYEALKAAWLFNWTVQSWPFYVRKLTWVGVWSGLLLAPLAAASFPLSKAPLHFVLATIAAALGMVILLLIRLYLGWAYICDRLTKETVVYEESGWYDGQKWLKPLEVLVRDRLVVTYQVQPILSRLQQTFWVCGGLMILGMLTWLIA